MTVAPASRAVGAASVAVMNETTSPPPVTTTSLPRTSRFTAWPLLISASGALALASAFLEGRPESDPSFEYPVNAEDLLLIDPLPYRISGALGFVLALLLLVTAAVWRHRVERRFTGSIGASLVGYGVLATAALVTLAYGWRGAVGDYFPGGPEEDTYDLEGLYNYFILTDFSPYIAFVPLVASAYGLAWMAFRERLVSRGLGAAAGLLATGGLIASFVTGVPGIPGAVVMGLLPAGIWLAFGRSPITIEDRA